MLTRDLYTTSSLAGVVNSLRLEAKRFLLDRFFPRLSIQGTEEIHLDIELDDIEIAPFVSPFSKGKIMTDLGYVTNIFKPAYVKAKNNITGKKVMTRSIGEQLGGDMSPEQRAQAALGHALQMQLNRIVRRKEVMASEVLRTGRCVIVGDDYPTQVVDYGRDAALTQALTGAARWGEAGVSPYADLERWMDGIGESCGAPVTDVVMDAKAWTLYRADPALRDALDTTLNQDNLIRLGYTPGAPGTPIYKGMIGSVNMYVYNDTYKVGGLEKRLLPDHSVIMASTPSLYGLQMHGAIMDPNSTYMAAEVYARSWIDDDLNMRMVESQSAPLVAIGRPNASMCVTVR